MTDATPDTATVTRAYRVIEVAEEKVSRLKSDYLRSFGWEYTSSTPGSYWMWRRSFADVNARRLAAHEAWCQRIGEQRKHYPYPDEMLTDTDTAISMTWLEIDPARQAEEDECDD